MPEQTQEQTPEQIAQESNAAFSSGFNEERGIDPAAKPAAEAKSETKSPTKDANAAAPPATAPAKPEGEVVDDYAGLPPKVKAEMDSMRSKLGALENIPAQLRTIHGHIGGLTALTRELKTAIATAKTVTETEGSKAPTQLQVESALKDPERMKRLKDDFPEWADAFVDELAHVRASIPKAVAPVDTAALKTEITQDINQRIDKAAKDAAAEARALAPIDLKHPGWEELVSTPQYDAWIKTQAADIQSLGKSSAPSDAIRLLDRYADHRKKEAEKAAQVAERTKRLESAITPSGVAVTASGEDPEAAFSAGFNEVRTGG